MPFANTCAEIARKEGAPVPRTQIGGLRGLSSLYAGCMLCDHILRVGPRFGTDARAALSIQHKNVGAWLSLVERRFGTGFESSRPEFQSPCSQTSTPSRPRSSREDIRQTGSPESNPGQKSGAFNKLEDCFYAAPKMPLLRIAVAILTCVRSRAGLVSTRARPVWRPAFEGAPPRRRKGRSRRFLFSSPPDRWSLRDRGIGGRRRPAGGALEMMGQGGWAVPVGAAGGAHHTFTRLKHCAD
jgi:hypothetical protein